MCSSFLKLLSEKKRNTTSVFVQTNATTDLHKWLLQFDSLAIDIGVSMDGWGTIFDWIRGPFFEKVLNNLNILNGAHNVNSITIDFTLSAFNVYHLPQFLERILELRQEYTKIKQCPVFQWAQQTYASPLAIPLKDRLIVLRDCQKIIKGNEEFFLDYEVLFKTLQMPQLNQEDILITKKWFEYLNLIRGYGIGEDELKIANALTLIP